MVRYQVILAYDGTHFAGYQRQARARTVQGVVEDALRQLGWTGRTILSAGRTDTGVHAAGQVIAFDLHWQHSPQELRQALNAHLPPDTAVQAVEPAAETFHPRYDALWRRYRYRLYCQDGRSPLQDRYAWRVWPEPSAERLQAAARLLPGAHDFAAFGTPPRPGGSTVRTVYEATWRQANGEWVFEVCANAFLYHMVRRLVFVQVWAGLGRLEPADVAQALEGPLPADAPVALAPGLAPPHGLTLTAVGYPPAGQGTAA